MFVEFLLTKPDGTTGQFATMPMTAVPNVNDMIEMSPDSKTRVLFHVVNRRWQIENNPDGGGSTVRLQVICVQLALEDGSMQDPGEEEKTPSARDIADSIAESKRPVKDSPQA